MNEILTIDEIDERYPDEWVLLDDPQVDESQEVVGGKVIFHGKDRNAMYRAAQAVPTPRNLATHYTGEISDDIVIASSVANRKSGDQKWTRC
ncbi:MAG: hypothetical protein WED34_06170 [Planctomycetales bacterium]